MIKTHWYFYRSDKSFLIGKSKSPSKTRLDLTEDGFKRLLVNVSNNGDTYRYLHIKDRL